METIADVAREILFPAFLVCGRLSGAAAQMYFKHANDAADLIADFHNFLTPRQTDCRLSIYQEFIRPPTII